MILRRSRPIGTEENATLASGRNYIAITFDDGFEDFLTQALPELEKRKIPATVFMIADGINREFGSESYAEKLLSLEQMRGLPPSLVTIGSHTLTHPMLAELSEGEARREIQQSKTKLEAILGREVRQFSFPYGGFNETLVELCREAGYKRVYTTLPAFAFERRDEFVTGRVRIDPTDWRLEVRLKLAGAYGWLPIAILWKRRIVSMMRGWMARPLVRPSAPRSMVR
jgi:peptidoglycan/xylan/chitin deacetylase (PgdA/CDA1 family)